MIGQRLIFLTLILPIIAGSAFGFVLNTEGKRIHEDCSNDSRERSPEVESINRARCEKFALPVGRIAHFRAQFLAPRSLKI